LEEKRRNEKIQETEMSEKIFSSLLVTEANNNACLARIVWFGSHQSKQKSTTFL